ncbi:hypothetical protein G6F68_015678 [Rhizopus microsporus]|nr:hypothetical protein G6F68_015678 [Rhizopus microsporus]
MRGQAGADMRLQGLDQRLVAVKAVVQHHIGHHDFRALLVRHAHHRRHAHGRVADQAVLDGCRADAVAGAGDDVVIAPHEADEALLVAHAQVARQQAGTHEFLGGGLGVVPVAQEHDRPPGARAPHGRSSRFAGRTAPSTTTPACCIRSGHRTR